MLNTQFLCAQYMFLISYAAGAGWTNVIWTTFDMFPYTDISGNPYTII